MLREFGGWRPRRPTEARSRSSLRGCRPSPGTAVRSASRTRTHRHGSARYWDSSDFKQNRSQ